MTDLWILFIIPFVRLQTKGGLTLMNTLTTQACLRTYNRLFKENDELYHEIARYFGLSDCALWILYTIREEEQALTQSDICESFFLG